MKHLDAPPRRLRTPQATPSGALSVERAGGRWSAGLIRAAAIVTRGAAEGHGIWIDSTFLNQVKDSINAGPGVKVRFTHPSLSDDGLGKFLGRATNATTDGHAVRADIHLSQTARTTPDGNLADYILDMAELHPDACGVSIVFVPDLQAQAEFQAANPISPDPDNVSNLPHARLSKLEAADMVDDPAANPAGLFHRPHLARDAEATLAYALGTGPKPTRAFCGIHPDRAAHLIRRFLQSNDLHITKGAQNMEIDALTSDQLRTQRPDLIAEITAASARATAAETAAQISTAIADERRRCATIADKAATFGLPHLASDLIQDGLSAEVATDKLKDAKIEALTRNAPTPPGPSDDPEPPPPSDTPEAWERDWNRDPLLRAEFNNRKSTFLAYCDARRAGRVRIYNREPRE